MKKGNKPVRKERKKHSLFVDILIAVKDFVVTFILVFIETAVLAAIFDLYLGSFWLYVVFPIIALMYSVSEFLSRRGKSLDVLLPVKKDSPIRKYGLPRASSDRIANCNAIVVKHQKDYDIAITSDNTMMFVIMWDSALKDLKELEPYIGTVPERYEKIYKYRETLAKDFQWKLRDAMDRERDNMISQLRGEYRNNPEPVFDSFVNHMICFSSRYDETTTAHAVEVAKAVSKAAGISFPYERLNKFDPELETPSTANLFVVDNMDGNTFEIWCADLLRSVGFVNVTVTGGSGDQGVDILAEKDGIKYAIQCKCYKNNLDNTPVQEVSAGRKIYGCQIGAVMTNRYFTDGAKSLAEATGTLLWDRDKLLEFIAQ